MRGGVYRVYSISNQRRAAEESTRFESQMLRKKQCVQSPLHINGEKGGEGFQLQIPGHTHLRGPLMGDKHRSAGRERHKNGCTSQVRSGR